MTDREPPKTVVEPGQEILDLKAMTDARVSLGRFGAGVPTKAHLSFLLDHARAREAVWNTADYDRLSGRLQSLGFETLEVTSLAEDRETYVRRPDLGRQISAASIERLHVIGTKEAKAFDIAIVIADGLSSSAVEINAVPLVEALAARFHAMPLSLAPIILGKHARVAFGDPVGQALGAKLSIILIGERPGLSAADSLGAYVTFAPAPGAPDSWRNCISNIRDGGMSIEAGADAIALLVKDMLRTGISGVGLKDRVASLSSAHGGALTIQHEE